MTQPPPSATDATRRLLAAAADTRPGGVYPIQREIETLLHDGADIEARDDEGYTPLLRCLARPPAPAPIPNPVYDAFHAVLHVLLQNGANLDAVTPDGQSVDALAARHAGEYDQTRAMIATERFRRSDDFLQSNFTVLKTYWLKPHDPPAIAQHAFLTACIIGSAEELRYILHLHPQAVRWKNNQGQSCLHLAVQQCRSADTSKIDLLIAAGADVNARTPAGITPLMAACAAPDFGNSTYAMIAPLVAAGADAGRRCNQGRTAADIASDRAAARDKLSAALEARARVQKEHAATTAARQHELAARIKKGRFKL